MLLPNTIAFLLQIGSQILDEDTGLQNFFPLSLLSSVYSTQELSKRPQVNH